MELTELEQKYVELGVEIQRLKAQQEKIGYKDDPIFLLSNEEYELYQDKIPVKNCWCWLRSPGIYHNTVNTVYCDGSIQYFRDGVRDFGVCVRPALNIKSLNPLKYKVVPKIAKNDVDRIIACGTTWVKITDNIYIAENPIGFEMFDITFNDYEISHIRVWLLNWFEKRKNW